VSSGIAKIAPGNDGRGASPICLIAIGAEKRAHIPEIFPEFFGTGAARSSVSR
jgi:hypothetical protein